jgi:glutamate dehydrogenase (NAD(P)+)
MTWIMDEYSAHHGYTPACVTGKPVELGGSLGRGVFNSRGLDIPALIEHVRSRKVVAGFPGSEAVSNQDLFELDCDILIPAALHCVITKNNARRIRARVIAEGANLPATPEADEILAQRGIHVLPDILTNAGGVTVSYFEWAQNLPQIIWDEDRVNREMHKILTQAYRQVADLAASEHLSLREAAYTIAVDRVARLRGT